MDKKKVQFVIDRGHPHGLQTEEREYDQDTPNYEIEEDLHAWALANTRCHFNDEGEFEV